MPTVVASSWADRVIEEFHLFQSSCADSKLSKDIKFAPCLPWSKKIVTPQDAAQYHLIQLKTYLKPSFEVFVNRFNQCEEFLQNIDANIEYFNNIILSTTDEVL